MPPSARSRPPRRPARARDDAGADDDAVGAQLPAVGEPRVEGPPRPRPIRPSCPRRRVRRVSDAHRTMRDRLAERARAPRPGHDDADIAPRERRRSRELGSDEATADHEPARPGPRWGGWRRRPRRMQHVYAALGITPKLRWRGSAPVASTSEPQLLTAVDLDGACAWVDRAALARQQLPRSGRDTTVRPPESGGGRLSPRSTCLVRPGRVYGACLGTGDRDRAVVWTSRSVVTGARRRRRPPTTSTGAHLAYAWSPSLAPSRRGQTGESCPRCRQDSRQCASIPGLPPRRPPRSQADVAVETLEHRRGGSRAGPGAPPPVASDVHAVFLVVQRSAQACAHRSVLAERVPVGRASGEDVDRTPSTASEQTSRWCETGRTIPGDPVSAARAFARPAGVVARRLRCRDSRSVGARGCDRATHAGERRRPRCTNCTPTS
jgi:hypothetical protein